MRNIERYVVLAAPGDLRQDEKGQGSLEVQLLRRPPEAQAIPEIHKLPVTTTCLPPAESNSRDKMSPEREI